MAETDPARDEGVQQVGMWQMRPCTLFNTLPCEGGVSTTVSSARRLQYIFVHAYMHTSQRTV